MATEQGACGCAGAARCLGIRGLAHRHERALSPLCGTVNHLITGRLRPDLKRTVTFGLLALIVAAAVRIYGDLTADCVLSDDSVNAANRDDAGLSSTQRKVLRGFQGEAARQGEGRFTVSLGDLAIISKVSKGSAHKHALTLDKSGWITFRHKGEPGKPLATVYSLRLPRGSWGRVRSPRRTVGVLPRTPPTA